MRQRRPAPGRAEAAGPDARVARRVIAPGHSKNTRTAQAALAFVAYMSTYSWPDSRMTSAITESVTARST